MPSVKGKNFPYTVAGLKRAETEALRTGASVQSDQSVYGPSNSSPMMNPDSMKPMTSRNTSLRRKKPKPYKTNRKI